MVVRFIILLLSSLTIAFRIEPALAFSGIQCKPSTSIVRYADRSTRLHSATNGDSKKDPSVFTKCVRSIAIAATSLQLLSAGHVNALPPVTDEAVISQVVESPILQTKFPDVQAIFSKEFDLSPLSDEFLRALPRFPLAGSKLLTTTVRPEMEQMLRRNQQFEEMKKIQWWKNTGFSLEKLNEDVQSQIKTIPHDFSHIGEQIKSLSGNWQILSGVLLVFFVADILQHSKQLGKIVDDQSLKLAEQETKLETSNSVNKEIINLLKAESLKLIEEVDSMIKEVDDKATKMSELNEALESLSLNVNNTDAHSKQMLTQYSRQLESAESLIKSLKSQIVEIPRKIAREVASEYKDKVTSSEKENAALKLEIVRIQEDAKSKGTTTNAAPAAPASMMPRFPPISASFPTSIFSPPASRELILKNEQQGAEILEMKARVGELEGKSEEEKVTKTELEGQIVTLQGTLSATEERLVEKKSEESAFFQELNARLTAMESQIKEFIVENGELKAKLLAAETESRVLMAKAEAATKSSMAGDAHDNNENKVLFTQLTAENDDLKQRLLNSDERLFDLQQDNLNKLEAAKIMTKQLNARLTEIGVQQENKDGKMLLQVKELEEAKDAVTRQLSEAQTALAELSSPSTEGVRETEVKAVAAEKAVKATKPKAKKGDKAAEKAALDGLADIKPYQMMKKSKKELEEILKSIGVTPPPLPTLSKSALLDLISDNLNATATVKI